MLATFEALAEPNRLQIVELLREKPRSVNDVVAKMDILQPQVSKHLRILMDAGLVNVRPDAQRRGVGRSDPSAGVFRPAARKCSERSFREQLDNLQAIRFDEACRPAMEEYSRTLNYSSRNITYPLPLIIAIGCSPCAVSTSESSATSAGMLPGEGDPARRIQGRRLAGAKARGREDLDHECSRRCRRLGAAGSSGGGASREELCVEVVLLVGRRAASMASRAGLALATPGGLVRRQRPREWRETHAGSTGRPSSGWSSFR